MLAGALGVARVVEKETGGNAGTLSVSSRTGGVLRRDDGTGDDARVELPSLETRGGLALFNLLTTSSRYVTLYVIESTASLETREVCRLSSVYLHKSCCCMQAVQLGCWPSHLICLELVLANDLWGRDGKLTLRLRHP